MKKLFVFKVEESILSEFNSIRERKFYGTSRQKLMEKILSDWVTYYAKR